MRYSFSFAFKSPDFDLGLNKEIICQSERAARKATTLQMATMYMVFGGTLLNLGVTLNGQGSQAMANALFVGAGWKTMFLMLGILLTIYCPKIMDFWLILMAVSCLGVNAGVFFGLFMRSMQRVKLHDKIEKMI